MALFDKRTRNEAGPKPTPPQPEPLPPVPQPVPQAPQLVAGGVFAETDDTLTPATGDIKSKIVPAGELGPTLAESLEVAEDTDAIEVDVKKRLSVLSRKIRTAQKNAVMSILTIGAAVVEARELLSLHGNGSYGKWLQSVGISRTNAHRCILAHHVFGDCSRLEQSTSVESQAIFLLSAKATPPAAAADALQLISDGKSLTAKTARTLLAKHSPTRPKNTKPAPVIVEVPSGRIVLHPKHADTSAKQMLAEALKMYVEPKRKAA